MDGSCHHAREQAAPSLHTTAEQGNFDQAEVVYATVVEWRFAALRSEVRQSCLRWFFGFSFPAQYTLFHDFSYNLPATRYPIQFLNLVMRAVGRQISEFLVKICGQEGGNPCIVGRMIGYFESNAILACSSRLPMHRTALSSFGLRLMILNCSGLDDRAASRESRRDRQLAVLFELHLAERHEFREL